MITAFEGFHRSEILFLFKKHLDRVMCITAGLEHECPILLSLQHNAIVHHYGLIFPSLVYVVLGAEPRVLSIVCKHSTHGTMSAAPEGGFSELRI